MICCQNIVLTLLKNMEQKVDGVKKLVANLGYKRKYVVYYRNLQLYLSLAMKLTNIDRILKLKQID